MGRSLLSVSFTCLMKGGWELVGVLCWIGVGPVLYVKIGLVGILCFEISFFRARGWYG